MEKQLYTVAEVATRVRVTPKTVWAWINDRKLAAVKIGREWRIRDEDLEAFIQERLSTAVLAIHGVGDCENH